MPTFLLASLLHPTYTLPSTLQDVQASSPSIYSTPTKLDTRSQTGLLPPHASSLPLQPIMEYCGANLDAQGESSGKLAKHLPGPYP